LVNVCYNRFMVPRNKKKRLESRRRNFARPIPKVGDDIYITSATLLRRGGLARVSLVHGPVRGSCFIGVKELKGSSFDWKYLSKVQTKLKKQFKNARAKKCPDIDPRIETN
jgi:hypothetical protein